VLALLFLAVLTARQLNQSLWRDEASSVWFARYPLSTLLAGLCDPHPSGYYLLLKAWQGWGEQEFWLRLPSVGAALLAVALTYRLARTMGGQGWAWGAALLLAGHPLQIWYAGEARMYMLAQAAGLGLVWLGWRLITKPGRWGPGALAYGLIALIAFGLDYVTILPFGLLQCLWLAQNRPRPIRWLSLQGAVLSVAALLWVGSGQGMALEHSYHTIFIAVQASRWGLDLTPDGAARWLLFISAGGGIVGLGLAWQWPIYLSSYRRYRSTHLLLVSGWVVLLLLAAVPRGFTLKRLLVVLLPYLALVTAYALAHLPHRTAWVIGLAGLVISLSVLPMQQREPWREVVTEIVATADPATVIWVDELAVPAFDYYRRQHRHRTNLTWTPLFGSGLPNLPDLAPPVDGSLWLITQNDPYRRLTAALPTSFAPAYDLLRVETRVGISRYIYWRRVTPLTDPTLSIPTPERATWGILLPSPLSQCAE